MNAIKDNLVIFPELLHSDSWKFLLIGAVIAFIVGIIIQEIKKTSSFLISCFILYALCEIAIHAPTKMFPQFMILILGTVALGASAGFLLSMIVTWLKSS